MCDSANAFCKAAAAAAASAEGIRSLAQFCYLGEEAAAAELRWKRVGPLDGTEQRGWLEIGWWWWRRFVATPRRLKSEVEDSE